MKQILKLMFVFLVAILSLMDVCAEELTPEKTEVRYCSSWIKYADNEEAEVEFDKITTVLNPREERETKPYESWHMSYIDNTLIIQWNKVWAPCDLTDFGSKVKVDGNVINIQGYYVAYHQVNCLCNYDFVQEYKVTPGEYTLILDGVNEGQIILHSGVELTLPTAGVQRTIANDIISISKDWIVSALSDEAVVVEVISADGLVLNTVTIAGDDSVSLATLPTGVYVIKASMSGKVSTQTLMK